MVDIDPLDVDSGEEDEEDAVDEPGKTSGDDDDDEEEEEPVTDVAAAADADRGVLVGVVGVAPPITEAEDDGLK